MSYQYITNRDSGNYTPNSEALNTFGYTRQIEGITLHWWGDPNTNPSFDGIVNYLCRDNGNTSAHFIATGTNRQVACIVDPMNVAWHSGSAWGNARTIGIELDPRGRPEDMDVVAELIADIRDAYGDVPLYWHNYFTQTTCPGVYTALVDHIDQLSYTKYSAAQWGQGGDKVAAVPTPVVTPPVAAPTPAVELYRLFEGNKQLAAYSVEANAYKGFVDRGKVGSIIYRGKDVTSDLVAKYTTPSPTTTDENNVPLPDTGKPVAEKHDYSEENNTLLKTILAILTQLLTKFTGIFK